MSKNQLYHRCLAILDRLSLEGLKEALEALEEIRVITRTVKWAQDDGSDLGQCEPIVRPKAPQ